MSRGKQALNGKHRSKAVPVLQAGGLSLTLASGALGATGTATADTLSRNAGVAHVITLREEEISDVSLATFYVLDKERAGDFQAGERRLAAGCACCQFARAPSSAFEDDANLSPPPRRPAPRHVQKKRP
jgi:hypothetical protein